MCIEFSFKRAGIPIVRNFLHCAEGVMGFIWLILEYFQKKHNQEWKYITEWKHSKMEKLQMSNVIYIYIKDVENILDGFKCKV